VSEFGVVLLRRECDVVELDAVRILLGVAQIPLGGEENDRLTVPVLGAVGALQFDVVRYRLEAEYNVQTELEPLNYSAAR